MKVLCLLFSGFTFAQLLHAQEIELSLNQAQTLGIMSGPLPARQSGELSGLSAQVVIPGNQMFTISAPLPGMVEQTLVGVGDPVRKGEKLATLQSPALAEAQRGLLQSATQAQLAKENLARDEQLWKDGIIPESRLRATQSQYREAQAAFAERRQLLKLAGMSDADIARMQTDNSLTSQLTITSPIDGVVLEKNASSGQRLEAAIPLFKVARLDPLALEIQAPLASTRTLKVGAGVTVPAYGAKGRLTAIGHSLSGSNQTVLLRALITEGVGNLRPGQFVEATIIAAANTQNQWSLPNEAIARLAKQALIFVQTPKGYRAENVTVLHEGATSSVVSGNLKGDEKIAMRGVAALKARLMGIGGE